MEKKAQQQGTKLGAALRTWRVRVLIALAATATLGALYGCDAEELTAGFWLAKLASVAAGVAVWKLFATWKAEGKLTELEELLPED